MERETKTERYRNPKEDRLPERDKLKDEQRLSCSRSQKKEMKKKLEKREKLKKLDKENLSDERASGQSCTLPRSSEGEFKDEKPKGPEMRVVENTGRGSGIANKARSTSFRREGG